MEHEEDEGEGVAQKTRDKARLTTDELLGDSFILDAHREHGTDASGAADGLLRDAEAYARRLLGSKNPAVALSLVVEFLRFQRHDLAETLKYRKHERHQHDDDGMYAAARKLVGRKRRSR